MLHPRNIESSNIRNYLGVKNMNITQEFLFNLSDKIKDFSILLLTDLCIRFHSPYILERTALWLTTKILIWFHSSSGPS